MFENPNVTSMFKSLVSQINQICPFKRSPYFSTEIYLKLYLDVLETGSSYRKVCKEALERKIKNYIKRQRRKERKRLKKMMEQNIEEYTDMRNDKDNEKKNKDKIKKKIKKKCPHHSSLQKRASIWHENGVFDVIYDELVSNYKDEFLMTRDDFIEIYIDSTNIRNKKGQDFLGFNYKDKMKRGNKITCIIDKDKFPLYTAFDKANTSDATILKRVIEDLDGSQGLPYDDKKGLPHEINIVADKGYIITGRKRVGQRRINLIAPYRKNKIYDNTPEEKISLGERHKIENVFSSLKNCRRIDMRYDKKFINYRGYALSGLIIMGMKIMEEKRKLRDQLNLKREEIYKMYVKNEEKSSEEF